MAKTNKLFEYCLEAAKVVITPLEPYSRTPTPQRTFKRAHHWPTDALSFAYAKDLVEIVLLRSQEASTAYNEAVKALELPGCQALISDVKKVISPYTSNLGQFTHKVNTAARKGNFGLPRRLIQWCNRSRYIDNDDYLAYFEYIGEFIRVGFNRQIDKKNEAWKVKPESAPVLEGFIIIKTLGEYLNQKSALRVKVENWNKHIDWLTSDNPSTRAERHQKQMVIQTLKDRYSWVLRHDAKLFEDADQWYRCRVNPGSIEVYRDELSKKGIQLERSNIETALAPYDEVTGYPRKWHN
ncbi:hypothetical protein ACFLTP_01850 [Chloroflexota bacterium]